MKYLSK